MMKLIKERKITNLAIIVLLPFVSEHGADDDACIFNNHLPCLNVPLAEKTTAMDSGPTTDTQRSDKLISWDVQGAESDNVSTV